MATLIAKGLIMSSFFSVPVGRVIDGDTFEVTLPDEAAVFGDRITVRIKGIDTPELSGPRKCEKRDAKKAKEVLSSILLGETVDLHHCQREKFFRLLCNARTSSNIDAGQYMMDLGMAHEYDGETKLKWKCR